MKNLSIRQKLTNSLNRVILSSLKSKMRKGEIITLNKWAFLPPHTSSYGTIRCDEKFKILSQELFLDNKISITVREMGNIYNGVLKVKDIEGDTAELGVFRGGSAKLISEVKGNKKLYLFDTFEGLPENDFETNEIKAGEIKGDSLEEVKNYLSKYKNLLYYPGIFPGSAKLLKGKNLKFSFINLDADLFEATYDGLVFFYPLLSSGGIIVVHDYRSIHLPGVRKAVDDFFHDKPETVIELWDTQALIVKI